MPKRGHQPRGLLVTDPGVFIVTLSATQAAQGTVVTVTAQWATSGGSPVNEAGKVVTWGKIGSGGSFSSATSTTNSVGVATVKFTVGSVIGATYTITASGTNKVTGSSPTLTVIADLVPYSITVTPTTSALEVGETEQLTAVVKNAIGYILSDVPTGASLSPTIATVSSAGLVTAVAVGSAVVQARVNGINSNSVAVTVGVDTTVASIVLAPSTLTIASGSQQITAACKNAAGAVIPGVQPTAWQTTNAAVVTVSSTGLVTYVGDGSANITATRDGITSNICAVTASAPVGGGGTGNPTDAELPRVTLTTTVASTPSPGPVVTVASVDDLQAAITAAAAGSTIQLAAGGSWTGNFTLPPKVGANASTWITITTTGTVPAEGTQMTEALAATHNLPKVYAAGTSAALTAALSSGFYRLIGIEVLPSGVSNTDGLVKLGLSGDEGQTTLAVVPTDLIIDRCYIHGTTSADVRRAVAGNAARWAVIDSCLTELHSTVDAQGIGCWNGPGPFTIRNNHIQASAAAIGFGGSDPGITNLVPSDGTITRNYCDKNPAWIGTWLTKTIIETKNSQRVLCEANVLKYARVDGQSGFAIVLWSVNQQHTAPWSVTRDWTVRYNVIVDVTAGFQLGAQYFTNDAISMNHVTIRHNVIIGAGGGRLFQIAGVIPQLTIEHTTAFSPYEASFAWDNTGALPDQIIKNNLVGGGTYQLFNGSQGATAWAQEAGPGSVFLGNVVADSVAALPTGNYAPSLANVGLAGGASKAYDVTATLADLTLAPGTWHKGVATDGTDPGADMTLVAASVTGVGGGF